MNKKYIIILLSIITGFVDAIAPHTPFNFTHKAAVADAQWKTFNLHPVPYEGQARNNDVSNALLSSSSIALGAAVGAFSYIRSNNFRYGVIGAGLIGAFLYGRKAFESIHKKDNQSVCIKQQYDSYKKYWDGFSWNFLNSFHSQQEALQKAQSTNLFFEGLKNGAQIKVGSIGYKPHDNASQEVKNAFYQLQTENGFSVISDLLAS